MFNYIKTLNLYLNYYDVDFVNIIENVFYEHCLKVILSIIVSKSYSESGRN